MWSYGIDVSNWQGVINWDVVNQSPEVGFVFMLVSDGAYRGKPAGSPLSIADAYNLNKSRCRKPKGGYHFARPHNTDPYVMAERYCNDAGSGLELPHVLDIEDYPELSMSVEAVADWGHAWVNRVYDICQIRAIIYNGAFFKRTGIIKFFPEHTWWLPSYMGNSTINPDPLTLPLPPVNGPRTWDMWQYTSHGRVPGISGNVDRTLMPTSKLEEMLGDDMPSLEEIGALVKAATGSAIYHANPHTSERVQEWSQAGLLPPIKADTPEDWAFQVFPNFECVYRTEFEAKQLQFIQIPDNGFRDDAWFGKLTLRSGFSL